ncbi:MAG: hypothetical protein HY819_00600 [Acidobacteria bacterium]|nr:hypothetical protein [Acidobacteriota bacterium]
MKGELCPNCKDFWLLIEDHRCQNCGKSPSVWRKTKFWVKGSSEEVCYEEQKKEIKIKLKEIKQNIEVITKEWKEVLQKILEKGKLKIAVSEDLRDSEIASIFFVLKQGKIQEDINTVFQYLNKKRIERNKDYVKYLRKKFDIKAKRIYNRLKALDPKDEVIDYSQCKNRLIALEAIDLRNITDLYMEISNLELRLLIWANEGAMNKEITLNKRVYRDECKSLIDDIYSYKEKLQHTLKEEKLLALGGRDSTSKSLEEEIERLKLKEEFDNNIEAFFNIPSSYKKKFKWKIN